jgi:hypothetical protein
LRPALQCRLQALQKLFSAHCGALLSFNPAQNRQKTLHLSSTTNVYGEPIVCHPRDLASGVKPLLTSHSIFLRFSFLSLWWESHSDVTYI